jgi:hypothetical protein
MDSQVSWIGAVMGMIGPIEAAHNRVLLALFHSCR